MPKPKPTAETRAALDVKADLQPFLPAGFLTSEERDMDSLALPKRPEAAMLFA
jgi:hypothetical protein